MPLCSIRYYHLKACLASEDMLIMNIIAQSLHLPSLIPYSPAILLIPCSPTISQEQALLVAVL